MAARPNHNRTPSPLQVRHHAIHTTSTENLPVSLLLLVKAQLEVVLAEKVVVWPLDGEAPLQQQGKKLSAVLLAACKATTAPAKQVVHCASTVSTS